GELLVELSPLSGRQLALDDLPQELVSERVTAVEESHEDAVRRRLSKGRPDLTLRPLHDQPDEPAIDRSTRDGEGLDDREGVGIEGRDPAEQDLDEGRRAVSV